MFNLCAFFVIMCISDATQLDDIIKNPEELILSNFIYLKLYTRENPSETLIKDEISVVSSKKPIKMIVHGFIESPRKEWVGKMTKALLRRYDCSVIVVDYTLLSHGEYIMAIQLGKIVGKHVGKFILKIHRELSMPLRQFHVIGHSLGSHVAGFIGKTVLELSGKKIWKITSLDAAGPVFRHFIYDGNERLNSIDADIVENLHTDDGRLGYEFPLGTVDYYANGGVRPQPGCYTGTRRRRRGIADVLAKILICSHIKSHVYYIRALNGEKISMTKCDSYESFKVGSCAHNEKIDLTEDISEDVRGLFYFDADN